MIFKASFSCSVPCSILMEHFNSCSLEHMDTACIAVLHKETYAKQTNTTFIIYKIVNLQVWRDSGHWVEDKGKRLIIGGKR